MSLMIRHFSHRHQLTLKCSQSPFQCDGCKEIGFGSCYQCEYPNCCYYLHDACAEASPTAFHPFFNGVIFSFYPQPPHTIVHCDACGNSVQGYRYHSPNLNPHPGMNFSIDLHPVCLKLKYVLENGDGLKLHLREKVSYSRYHLSSVLQKKCQHCESTELSKWLKGWAYVSSDGAHRYHVACVRDLMYDKWKTRYFQGSSMINNGTYIANGSSSSVVAPLSVMASASQTHAVVQHNNSSTSSSRPKLLKIAKIVIGLIISAIFGEPTGIFFAAAELLRHD